METGFAIGGPRDKVKLTASADWDGRVVQSGGGTEGRDFGEGGAIKRYYPGRYRWSATIPGWVWVPEQEQHKGLRTPRSGGYGRKP